MIRLTVPAFSGCQLQPARQRPGAEDPLARIRGLVLVPGWRRRRFVERGGGRVRENERGALRARERELQNVLSF